MKFTNEYSTFHFLICSKSILFRFYKNHTRAIYQIDIVHNSDYASRPPPPPPLPAIKSAYAVNTFRICNFMATTRQHVHYTHPHHKWLFHCFHSPLSPFRLQSTVALSRHSICLPKTDSLFSPVQCSPPETHPFNLFHKPTSISFGTSNGRWRVQIYCTLDSIQQQWLPITIHRQLIRIRTDVSRCYSFILLLVTISG